ncbi:uncharacterized protein B0T23DRAFT_399525 [Neurospora hispaniola]|uniref:Uncharacterized protein n=1 Tax=Neurospora hispaniola TaxID=588809 RepID=A0AAJ0HZK5_9PEZI|nr:hypothetical protein B0T23DRAFT_399525 [Neurospora hispaniola]
MCHVRAVAFPLYPAHCKNNSRKAGEARGCVVTKKKACHFTTTPAPTFAFCVLPDGSSVNIAAHAGDIVGGLWRLCLQDEGNCLLRKQLPLERGQIAFAELVVNGRNRDLMDGECVRPIKYSKILLLPVCQSGALLPRTAHRPQNTCTSFLFLHRFPAVAAHSRVVRSSDIDFTDIQESREIAWLATTAREALQPVIRAAPTLTRAETPSGKATPRKARKAPTRVVQSRSAAAGESSNKVKAYPTLSSAIAKYE